MRKYKLISALAEETAKEVVRNEENWRRFERLSDVFEELRSDAGEREYSIQTEEAKKADKELKKENREYEKFLSDLSTEQRNFLENYMDIVDHAHFQEQQRAYYQGIVDAVQILAGLGIVKESVKVKELLNTIMK